MHVLVFSFFAVAAISSACHKVLLNKLFMIYRECKQSIFIVLHVSGLLNWFVFFLLYVLQCLCSTHQLQARILCFYQPILWFFFISISTWSAFSQCVFEYQFFIKEFMFGTVADSHPLWMVAMTTTANENENNRWMMPTSNEDANNEWDENKWKKRGGIR